MKKHLNTFGTCNEKCKHLLRKIKKFDKLIDTKIANYNSQFIRGKIGKNGTINKQDFWKIKRKLAPKNTDVQTAITNETGNEITDPINIKREYFKEFRHRLRKRDIKPGLEDYEKIKNNICMLRLKAAKEIVSPDFSIIEVKCVVSDLKTGQCIDPTGLIREIFKNAGDALLYSVCDMANSIKRSKTIPKDWNKLWIKTLKKKKGSFKKLDNYRGIFIVPILSIIFEKLLKNRIIPVLKQNMSHFQNGGSKGKGIVDNLFILRELVDHSKYLNKEIWLTFYDIEKCFDSLWLEDCINSLCENGIRDDTLSLIYLLNRNADVTVQTPFGETDQFSLRNLVKQGTVLGPVLNNTSLDKVCKESHSYHLGSVELRTLEFVDDIADPNRGKESAQISNKLIGHIQNEKRITFSSEKCELLKIHSKNKDEKLILNGKHIELVDVAKYLGDKFNSKGNYFDLCKERFDKAKGSTFELIALCKEIKFGNRQIENMLILYQAVFLPSLIYNCETWSNMTSKEFGVMQSAQLFYLRNVMEVPKSTPIVALFLELGILPIRFEIEKRQLFFLKRILGKENDDPVLAVYKEQLTYKFEKNWANYILELRCSYNLPLNDNNNKQMTVNQWKIFVKSVIRKEAFMQLTVQCDFNRKTMHLKYNSLMREGYVEKIEPKLARTIFRAKVRMYDIKVNYKRKYRFSMACPFCMEEDETFEHVFSCPEGIQCSKAFQTLTFQDFCSENSFEKLKKTAKFLLKYSKYREAVL